MLNMNKANYDVSIYEKDIVIPTYEVGEPNKNPIFSEKRVYQGSSGKVYPYPVIEKIYDEKIDKTYRSIFLENQYIQIVVLPEIGGRIYRGYDKTNDYDFVYYNQVIKPALVGLTGPWISGGIEFNWPQHHRPTTFSPVGYKIRDNNDGSKSLLLHDIDQMYGTEEITRITLYPDKAYVEIKGQLYNGTPFPQTFLWWANPAVAANDYTQSIFPPDVHAVMDHGKRDVSRFPIATGVYYKKDYSEGVDISRYKNIPVPTSFMAEKSKYDFLGGYDYKQKAGVLHVADHHISPGKKQWTWGNGDFGKAWDRNLTDEDGPYIELMTGVYTDNQPDFTWLKPFEEKIFKQYFMPYKAVGSVKNASIHAIVNMETKEDGLYLCVYATSIYKDAKVVIKNKESVCVQEKAMISPLHIFEKTFAVDFEKDSDLTVEVYDRKDNLLVSYTPEEKKIEKTPEPAEAAKTPTEIMTNEELYLTGLHIEQYRHATYEADNYYLEGLKRDSGDIRINNAYGSLLLRRGLFKDAESYFRKAIERLTWKNPNPYNSEAYYNLGVCLLYQQRIKEAYDAFYKATWSNEQQEMAYYYLAAIATGRGDYEQAREFIEKSLVKNSHNMKARGLKAIILRLQGKINEAWDWVSKNLVVYNFDYVSQYERILLMKENGTDIGVIRKQQEELVHLMRNHSLNFIQTAIGYSETGRYMEAIEVLKLCTETKPMLKYYEGYYYNKLGLKEESDKALKKAGNYSPNCTFPNKLEDILALEFSMISQPKDPKAPYYLGNLYYDKKQYDLAKELWEKSRIMDETYPTVLRNLSLLYYNQYNEKERAKEALEKAFHLDTSDARVFLELDQLYKKLGVSAHERISFCEKYSDTLIERDDMYVEYITLLNQIGDHKRAYELMMKHKFHPWEGGEGKITTQYKIALLEMAKVKMNQQEYENAILYLKEALVYPDNLGEGKLEGTKDNHLNYYLGFSYEAIGNMKLAQEYYSLASLGTDEPAGMMYYYDQPADMILYQGLALKKLDRPIEANAKFYKLLDYGEQHIFDEVKIDYFAVSLPDFLIFKNDLDKRNKAHCYYLIGLANLGLDKKEEAKKNFDLVLQLDSNHMECIIYKKMLD